MSAQNVYDSTVDNIIKHIQDNIEACLSEIRTDRPDGKVTTEKPVDYFIYSDAIAYKTPAIFVVANNADFRLSKGQNHINANVLVYVSAVVEDRNQRLLTLKTFRYHDALHKCLDRVQLVDSLNRVKNVVRVVSSDLSDAKKMSTTDSVFRKEVMLTLEVEHYESEN